MQLRSLVMVASACACFFPVYAEDAEAPPVTLGITVQSKEATDARLTAQGAPSLKIRSCVVVTEVDPSGPSARLLSPDNAIISIDGAPTPDLAAYEKVLKGLKPGSEVFVKGLYLAPSPQGEKKWVPGSVAVRVQAVAPLGRAPVADGADVDAGTPPNPPAAPAQKPWPKPDWDGFEDLDDVLSEFPRTKMTPIEQFIRYGDSTVAAKGLRGDRFDREEADAAAAAHRKGLSSRRFFLQRAYRWDDREPAEGKEETVRLRVLLPFSCVVPAHDPMVGVKTYNDRSFWVLRRDNTVEHCPSRRVAEQLDAAGKVLYFPEIFDQCELILWPHGDKERLKAIARTPGDHVVNIALQRLRVERPWSKGLFKLSALRESDYDSGSLLISYQNGNNGPEDLPNYFVTRELDETAPEYPTVDLVKLEIVNIAGEQPKVVFTWSDED